VISKLLKQILSDRDNFYDEPLLDPNSLPQKSASEQPFTVSVVIPAYNAQASILACLTSIEQSSFNINYHNRLEVIVVDDGSTDNTWKSINDSDLSLNLTTIRQTNHGQAQALNTGISTAKGDIIISCDSDMVLEYYTIEHFASAHKKTPNALFTGFRQNISETDPRVNPHLIRKNGSHIGPFFSNDERIIFTVPGWPSNMCLASDHFRKLGKLHSLWMPDNDAWLLPDMVIGALFSLSRSVFNKIGGYDERLIGWGCTDSYLAAKAIGANQYIIPLYPASGLHINHPIRLANRNLQYKRNRKLFFKFIETTRVDSHPNWLVHAKNRIVESFIKNLSRPVLKHRIKVLRKDRVEDKLIRIDQFLALGQYHMALAYIRSEVKENNNAEIQYRLAKTLSGMNQYKKAIYILEKITLPIKSVPKVKIELVINQAAEGNFKSAQKTLKELAKNFPRTHELLYWQNRPTEKHIKQGQKFFDQGFYQIAIRCFEAALIINPYNKIALKYRNLCTKVLFH
jgi:glycosyltransferase involved in cell wall biosynthesis